MQIILCSIMCLIMHSETKNKQIPPNIHLIGIVLHSYCHSHKSHWFLRDTVLVPPYKVYFSIRINKNGSVHLGSMGLQISIKQFSKITGHKSLSQRQTQIGSYFWSRQKAKPRIREAICMCLRESCLCK